MPAPLPHPARHRAMRTGLWPALLLSALLAGCSVPGTGAPAQPGPTTPTVSAAQEPSESGEPTAGSAGATTSADPAATIDLTGADLLDQHQNGTLLSVDSVRVERTGIVVGITLVNGFTETVGLNRRGVHLIDDLGNSYNFDEPDTNAELALEPGAELNGELVFLGVLPDEATSLVLKANVFQADDNIDVLSRFDRTTSPEFLIEGIRLS